MTKNDPPHTPLPPGTSKNRFSIVKNGVFRGPESDSGVRIGLRAVVFEMSEKSIYRKMGRPPFTREIFFFKMGSVMYIFQNFLQKKGNTAK